MEQSVRHCKITNIATFSDKSRHTNAQEGLKRTLDQLGLDYLDLFLVHWPQGARNTFDHVSVSFSKEISWLSY